MLCLKDVATVVRLLCTWRAIPDIGGGQDSAPPPRDFYSGRFPTSPFKAGLKSLTCVLILNAGRPWQSMIP